MSEPLSMEQMLYAPILEENIQGLEHFEEKYFRPCQGTILVVLPPKVTKIKNIDLPEVSQKDQLVGRVVAAPKEFQIYCETDGSRYWRKFHGPDPACPVEPGDWVLFRVGASCPVMFSGRKDLVLLNYCEGPESDLLGFFSQGEGLMKTLKDGCKEKPEAEVSEVSPGLTKECVTSTVG